MRLLLLAVASVVSIHCAQSRFRALPPRHLLPPACVPTAPSHSRFALAVLGSGGLSARSRVSGYVVFLDGVARALVDVCPGAFVRLGEMEIDLHHLDTILSRTFTWTTAAISPAS